MSPAPSRPIPILMYHQVDHLTHAKEPMRGLVVAPKTFAAHMQTLAALGYAGLGMNALLPYLRGEKVGKVVGITFDDGYENNLTHAMPVLQRHGFSATCYVVSRHMGKTNAWDAKTDVPEKRLMTPAQIDQWLRGGQSIGSHTQNHIDLIGANVQQASDEIAESRSQLKERFGGESALHFCYPYGRYSADNVKMVEKAGYLTATTTRRARANAGDALLELPRVLVSRTTGRLMLAAKLLTTYEDRRR